MSFVVSLLKKVIAFFYYPIIRLYVGALSEKKRLQSIGKPPKIFWEHKFRGQPILLLALYEKGSLRPDILRLIKAAKKRGMYVLGVNTLKLSNPNQFYSGACQTFQPFSSSRDFSSYKTGFMHIYKRGWEAETARVLMANDSVFYSTKGLATFLSDMVETEVEVLGSTENFDMVHHLGSFCISFDAGILQNPGLKEYWRNYKLTDVRPTVIWRGELELSKTLIKVVSSDSNFQALYSGANFVTTLNKDPKMLDFALQNGRVSPIFPWQQTNIASLLKLISKRYLHNKNYPASTELKLTDGKNDWLKKAYVNSVDSIMYFIKEQVANDTSLDRDAIERIIASELTETFLSGSQIHQNAAILLNLGLPFVKLDGLYRGIFNQEDISNIVKQLNVVEAQELQAILMNRPYGGKHLIGWQKVAFERGLI